jgi:hypothetical protein
MTFNEGFNSLEDIGEQFKKGDDIEIGAQFAKGAVLVSAAAQGWNIDETAAYCANITLRHKRTVYRYYSTVKTFPQRLYDLPYEHHAQCADTIDYRKNMTEDEFKSLQANALRWLQSAKSGGYSTRALRAAIRASGGRVDEKPIVLLDGVEFEIYDYLVDSDGTNIELFAQSRQIEELKQLGLKGVTVKVTLVHSPPVAEKELP